METFTNEVIFPGNLPQVEKEKFNPIEKKYLTIILIRTIVFFLLAGAVLAAYAFLPEQKPDLWVLIITVSILLLGLAVMITIAVLGFQYKGYLLREKDISFQKGLITFKLTTVPFNRIQHVEVNQGFLPKLFGLSSVKIYTAGGSYSDLSIPGLISADALKLKAALSEQISRYE